MVNVMPTLINLCGLPGLNGLDGHDMSGLLKKPDSQWPYPAISEIQNGNAAVRTQDWRFIRYHDGSEELYDRKADPNEWYNLAGDARYAKVMEDHRRWVPLFAPALPGKSAFYFDPYAYTYMDRKTGAFIDGKK
jgi:arylsulfatase A-like enzyme